MVAGVAAPDWYGSFLPPPVLRDQVPLLASWLRPTRERRPQIQRAMAAMRAIAAAPMAMPAIAPGAKLEWPPMEVAVLAALTADDAAADVGVTVTVAGRVALVMVAAYSSPSSWP